MERSLARPAPRANRPIARLFERRAARGDATRPTGRPGRSELAVLSAEIARLAAELARAQAQLRQLEAQADTDLLTAVFNRRGFERELGRALSYVNRYGGRAALLYLDLDGFKPGNGRRGHAAGDAILRAVAATLTRHVRASDTVARLGGDEFGLILWNLSEADALKKVRALEMATSAISLDWEGGALSVGASIGLAILNPSDDLATVMAAADRAMYARKGARRGNILPSNH